MKKQPIEHSRRMMTDRQSHRHKKTIVCVVTVSTLLFLAALSLDLSPFLRGPSEWRWPYAHPGKPIRLLIPATAMVIYLVIAFCWMRRISRTELDSAWERSLFLATFILATPIVQVSLLMIEEPDILKPLFYRTVSSGASGVFSVGSTVESLPEFLRDYPVLMPSFPVHPQRYPPGLPILFYFARRFFEAVPRLGDMIGLYLRRYQCHDLTLMRLSNATIASAVVQMALPAASGLSLIPLYALARNAYGKREAAYAAMLFPMIPSVALWSGHWEQLLPTLTCACWLFLLVALKNIQWSSALASGVLLSVTSVLNFGTLALLAPMGMFALVWLVGHPEWRQLHSQSLPKLALAFTVGLAGPWVAYRATTGTGFLDIWEVSMSYHLGLKRSYWTWLPYHLFDFFTFLGIPLALLFGAGVLSTRGTGSRTTGGALSLGFALGLLALDISGTSRGEVARVWLFLTPFATLVAVSFLATHLSNVGNFMLVASLLALQLITFNAFLRVVTTGVTDPPDRNRSFTIPRVSHTTDAVVQVVDAEAFALLGYDLQPAAGGQLGTLGLTLYWQSLRQVEHSYTVFTHLVSPQGELVAQHDSVPVGESVPTSCWSPGEVVTDEHVIHVPPDLPAREYVLRIGLYSLETLERLRIVGIDAGMSTDHIELDPIPAELLQD